MYSFQSPFGMIDYDWHQGQCHAVSLQQQASTHPQHQDPVSAWFLAYFSGTVLPLPPLCPARTTFQASMRIGLCAIPLGEVKTYGELATILNTAPRALGQALGANPLPILIPCHRIVSANGLGGFHYGQSWKKTCLHLKEAKQSTAIQSNNSAQL